MKHRRGVMLGRRAFAELSFRRFQASRLSFVTALFFLVFLLFSEGALASQVSALDTGKSLEIVEKKLLRKGGVVDMLPRELDASLSRDSLPLARCEQDGMVISLKEGGFFEGVIYPYDFVGNDAWSLCSSSSSSESVGEESEKIIRVVEEPSLPLLLFPYVGWTYRVSAPAPEKGRSQEFSAVLQALCEDLSPVCQTTIMFVVPAIDESGEPPGENSSSDFPSSRLCAAETVERSRVYSDDATYVDQFIFDPFSLSFSLPSDCTNFVAELSFADDAGIPFGLLAVMPPYQYPLSYIFSVPTMPQPFESNAATAPEVQFEVPYTIRCRGKEEILICADALHFYVNPRPAPACPSQNRTSGTANTAILVGPSSTTSGMDLAKLSGLECYSSENEKRRIVIENVSLSILNDRSSLSPPFPGTLTVISDGTAFRYDAPPEEMDVMVRIQLECATDRSNDDANKTAITQEKNTVPVSYSSFSAACELTLVFLVSAEYASHTNSTEPPSDNDHQNSIRPTSSPSDSSGDQNDGGDSVYPPSWLFDVSYDVPLGGHLSGQLRIPTNMNTSVETREKIDACPAIRFTQAVGTASFSHSNLWTTDGASNWSRNDGNTDDDEEGNTNPNAFLVDPSWLFSDGFSSPASFLLSSSNDLGSLSSLPIQHNSGAFFLNLLGQFTYQSPYNSSVLAHRNATSAPTYPSQSGKNDTASAPSSFIDVVGVYVWCVTSDYFGSIRLFFTNYEVIPSEDEDSQGSDESNGNNTAFPSSPPSSSLNHCSNVYYYTTPVGVSLFSSLAGINGQTPCAMDRYYSLTQQPSRGWLKLNSSGEFVYSPLPELETAVEAKFNMFCANRLLCEGVIFIVVSDAFADDNESNPQPDHPSDGNASSSFPSSSTPPFSSVISCEGTCTAHPSWITLPVHHFWDTNMEVDGLSSPLRDDGVGVEDERAHRWFSIRWRGDALVLSTQTAIGNMGVRFPTFDVVENFSFFRPSLSDAQRYSASFNGSCLSHQGVEGLAEDVWVWDQLQANNGTGHVGPLYNKGASWYQTFGGKHDQCNIFQTYDSACQYAPLLTPAVVSSSSSSSLLRGIWSVAIKDCTATWTSSLSYPRLAQLQQDGQFSLPPSTGISSPSLMNSSAGLLPHIAYNSISSSSGSSSSVPPQGAVFRFSAPRRVEGLLFTEAVQPRSWVAPQEGIEVNLEASQVRIGLQQYVEVIKTALEYPFTTDAQFFEFVVEESPSVFSLSSTTVASTTDTTTLFEEGRTAEGDALLQSSISAPGDIGFGINLLIYPSLASNSPSVELTQNHRVVGFKWLQQQWHAPGNEECHTCTGVKLRCYAGDDFSTGSYEGDVFPSGDCPPGVGRVYFYKGPEITERDVREKCPNGSFSTPSSLTSSSLSAPSAEGWLLNRRGFSLTKDCANHYQNLTLRGVLSGSGKLTTEQKAALHVEGMLLLQVLMSDGYRYNIRLHISMFVSFVNTVLTAGGVDVLSVIRDDLQANQNAGDESVVNSTTSTTLSPATSNPTSTTRKPTANFNPDVTDDDTEKDDITDTANATDDNNPAFTDNPNSTTTEMNGATGTATIRRAALNVSGELHVCRSSRYFPVLDPLGISTPLDPLPLPGGVEPSHGSLCVDDLSRTYGPQDWSLVVVDAAPLHPYLQLRIDNIFVDYQRVVWPIASSDTTEDTVRVYLRYVDPVTHEVLERPPSSILSVPSFSLTSTKNESVKSSTPQCHWWKFTAPFLAYRAVGDVSTLSGASSSSSSSLSSFLSSSMSPEMARALNINQSQFAFLFVPGALGWTGEAEVVVEATLLPSSSALIRTVPSLAASDSSNSSTSSSRVEFRQKLHVTPYLTDASRYGVSMTVSGKDSSTNAVNAGNKDKQDFFAFFVITTISVLLILSVVIFFVADSKKPLPQWVPRGDILRSTVRSLLPHALRKSRKKAHRVATTDGSDGEIHVVEIPIVKTNYKDMYEAMSSGKY